MKGPSRVRAALAAALILLVVGCTSVPTEYREPAPLSAESRTTLNLRVHDRVWQLVNDKYFDEKFRGVDWPAMKLKYRAEAAAAPDDTALYRVLAKLCMELKQSHLAALPPRTVHEKDSEHRAAIGLRWLNIEGKRIVTDIVPGGAAADAGVKAGWLIVARDGRAINEREIFVGKLGQPVSFEFLDLDDRPVALTLEPRLLDFERLIARDLPGGFRYLRFDRFGSESLHWLSEELKAHRSAPGVIIDLRQNSGGNTVVNMIAVQEFFDHRVATGQFVRRDGKAKETHSMAVFSARYAGRVAILIGPGSASASEIFAHVLQHEKRATVIGRRSAGAVIVSRFYDLPGGGELQVPIQDYIGLDGQRLEGRGVTPDIEVVAPKAADWRAGRDVDLAAALAALVALRKS
jgi:carboxyl-terminal processing protease